MSHSHRALVRSGDIRRRNEQKRLQSLADRAENVRITRLARALGHPDHGPPLRYRDVPTADLDKVRAWFAARGR